MKKTTLFFGLLLSLMTINAYSQWTKAPGPDGGSIFSLLSDNTYIYAGTDDGIIRSADGGTTWIRINSGLTPVDSINDHFTVHTIVKSGGNLVALVGATVYYSSNNGNIWNTTSLINNTISLIVDQNSNVLYATTASALYKSTDNGVTWVGMQTLYSTRSVIYADNSYLYISNGMYGLDRINLSSSSSATLVGLPSGTNAYYQMTSTLSGDYFMNTGTQVYHSTDGFNWTATSLDITNAHYPWSGVFYIATNGSTVYAQTITGVYYSSDNGVTWLRGAGAGLYTTAHPYGLAANSNNALAFGNLITFKGSDMYLGTQNGVFKTSDNGATWVAKNNGIQLSNVQTVFGGATAIFSGMTNGGIYKSTDGSNWTLSSGYKLNAPVNKFAEGNGYEYAATDSGLYVSSDNGATWIAKNAGMVGDSLRTTTVALSGTTVFIGTYKDIFKSTDNGTTWIGLNFTGVSDMVIMRNNIFVNSGASVYKSTDNGSTWADIGLTPADSFAISNLLIKDKSLFAGGGYGIFRSLDSGATWHHLPPAVGYALENVSTMVTDGTNIFADNMISTDNGDTWYLIDNTGMYEGGGAGSLYITGYDWFSSNAIFNGSLYTNNRNNSLWRKTITQILTDMPQPTLTETSPSNGMSLTAGISASVQWQFANTSVVDNVKIEFSIDNGATWNLVTSSAATTYGLSGGYNWLVPNTPSDSCKIRVTDVLHPTMTNTSLGFFKIIGSPSLTFTYPNGGETWTAGTAQKIKWTHSGSSVNLDLYLQYGSNMTVIMSSTSGADSVNITVPNKMSNHCRIFAINSGYPYQTLDSSAVFTIVAGSTPVAVINQPLAGDSVTAGSNVTIAWAKANVTNVTLEYSTDYGSTWNPIVSGVSVLNYTWMVPSSLFGFIYVRIIDAANGTEYDRVYVTVKTAATTDIKNTEVLNDLILLPNPATNELRIITQKPISKIEIYNVMGQIELTTIHSIIDVSTLQSGIYIVRAYIANSIETVKIIKQ